MLLMIPTESLVIIVKPLYLCTNFDVLPYFGTIPHGIIFLELELFPWAMTIFEYILKGHTNLLTKLFQQLKHKRLLINYFIRTLLVLTTWSFHTKTHETVYLPHCCSSVASWQSSRPSHRPVDIRHPWSAHVKSSAEHSAAKSVKYENII